MIKVLERPKERWMSFRPNGVQMELNNTEAAHFTGIVKTEGKWLGRAARFTDSRANLYGCKTFYFGNFALQFEDVKIHGQPVKYARP